MRRALFITLLLLAPPALAAAQNFERAGAGGMAMEAIRPSLSNADEQSFTSAAYFLSGHTALRGGARLIMELPFAYANTDFGDSGGAIGDPYIGLQFQRGRSTFDFGFRAPLADEEKLATVVGMLADIDRMEAFAPDILTLRAGFSAQSLPVNGITFGMKLAPAALIWTGDGSEDTEVLLTYGGNAGYRSPATRLTLAGVGRAWLSESDLDFSERTSHQLWLAGDFGAGTVRPGFYVGVPLDDDMAETVDVAFGITLQILFGRDPQAVAVRR